MNNIFKDKNLLVTLGSATMIISMFSPFSAVIAVTAFLSFVVLYYFICFKVKNSKTSTEKGLFLARKNVIQDRLPVFLFAIMVAIFAILISITSLPIKIKIPVSFFLMGVFFVILKMEQIIGDKKFDRIDKTWYAGLKAEVKVENDLKNIPDLLEIANFNIGGENIDNIGICSRGIFIVEVKAHKGLVSYKKGKLLRDGDFFEKDFMDQVWRQINYLQNILKNKFGRAPFIVGVLEFVNAQRDSSLNGP